MKPLISHIDHGRGAWYWWTWNTFHSSCVIGTKPDRSSLMLDWTRKVILGDFILRMRNCKRTVSLFAKDQAVTKWQSHTPILQGPAPTLTADSRLRSWRLGKGTILELASAWGGGGMASFQGPTCWDSVPPLEGAMESLLPRPSTRALLCHVLWGQLGPGWQLSGVGLWQGK